MNFYNENDKKAAAWLRELIAQGHIAPGIVDERSICDIRPEELADFRQVHLFAGVGGWSLALRIAGVPDDARIWTGSCPCQPFSISGQGKGKRDKRHLWPFMRGLVAGQKSRPAVVFGEQVASPAGRGWLAGIRADLEALAYAVGAADLCAAGASAPHLRQRLFWVGHGSGIGFAPGWSGHHAGHVGAEPHANGQDGRLAHGEHTRSQGRIQGRIQGRKNAQGQDLPVNVGCGRTTSGLAYSQGERPQINGTHQAPIKRDEPQGGGATVGLVNAKRQRRAGESLPILGTSGQGAQCNFWAECDTLPCLDGKLRRIEPGSFPLAHGIPARVGRLRGYGNAIVPQIAAEFIAAFFETLEPSF